MPERRKLSANRTAALSPLADRLKQLHAEEAVTDPVSDPSVTPDAGTEHVTDTNISESSPSPEVSLAREPLDQRISVIPPPPPPRISTAMVNISSRITPETSLALQTALSERRYTASYPTSKQDILEVALREWLMNHGYLK